MDSSVKSFEPTLIGADAALPLQAESTGASSTPTRMSQRNRACEFMRDILSPSGGEEIKLPLQAGQRRLREQRKRCNRHGAHQQDPSLGERGATRDKSAQAPAANKRRQRRTG